MSISNVYGYKLQCLVCEEEHQRFFINVLNEVLVYKSGRGYYILFLELIHRTYYGGKLIKKNVLANKLIKYREEFQVQFNRY